MDEDIKWRHLYEAAILELNPEELQNKITLARNAMSERMARSTHSPDAGSVQEQQTISDAMLNLATIERMLLRSQKTVAQTDQTMQPGGAYETQVP